MTSLDGPEALPFLLLCLGAAALAVWGDEWLASRVAPPDIAEPSRKGGGENE